MGAPDAAASGLQSAPSGRQDAPNAALQQDGATAAAGPPITKVAAAPAPTHRPLHQGFVLGAMAACMAATFTNPWEVVKTRLQLQGELIRTAGRRGGDGAPAFARVYRSAPHAFAVIARAEGVRGLQRGLFPAYLYQTVMNGARLGGYEPAKHALLAALARVATRAPAPDGGARFEGAVAANVARLVVPPLAGMLCGLAAAVIGSPLYLIKTRMQAHATDPRLAGVGAQHNYRNTAHAIVEVVREGGVLNLWRGCTASMLRTGVGSAVQLASYDSIKRWLLRHPIVTGGGTPGDSADTFAVHFSASMATGLLVTLAMNPFDVVTTRLYNQNVEGGAGQLYKGPMDCFAKTVRAEGLRGLYKGFTAHWLRVGSAGWLTFTGPTTVIPPHDYEDRRGSVLTRFHAYLLVDRFLAHAPDSLHHTCT